MRIRPLEGLDSAIFEDMVLQVVSIPTLAVAHMGQCASIWCMMLVGLCGTHGMAMLVGLCETHDMAYGLRGDVPRYGQCAGIQRMVCADPDETHIIVYGAGLDVYGRQVGSKRTSGPLRRCM